MAFTDQLRCAAVALGWALIAACGANPEDPAEAATDGSDDGPTTADASGDGSSAGPGTSGADATQTGTATGDDPTTTATDDGSTGGDPPPPPDASSWPGIPEPVLPWWDAEVPPVTHRAASGTIPADAGCGSVVQWSGDTGQLVIDAEGCDDDPLWIVGTGVTATASNGDPHEIRGRNLVVIGIDFRGEDGVLTYTGDRVVMRAITVVDPATDNGSAMFIGGTNAVIDDADIGPSGNWIDQGGPDVDHHCIKTGDSSDIWVLRSTIHECQGDGIQFGDQNAYGGHHYYVAGNDIYDNCQTGLWVKRADDIVMVANRLWGHTQGCQSDAVAMGAQYENTWITFAYNEMWNNGGGIKVQSAELGPRFMIGNVVRDCTTDPGTNPHASHGITSRASGNPTYYLHNTIDQCAGALSVVNGTQTAVHGNLTGGGAVNLESPLENTNNFEGDAQLDADFVPQPGSAAIDADGTTPHDGYVQWEAHYGISIADDRPLDGDGDGQAVWDLGAKEAEG